MIEASAATVATTATARYVSTAGIPSSGYAPYSSYALRQSGTTTAGAFPASAPKPNGNIVEVVDVPDVVVDEPSIEDRLAALEAKTADLPDKAQGRG